MIKEENEKSGTGIIEYRDCNSFKEKGSNLQSGEFIAKTKQTNKQKTDKIKVTSHLPAVSKGSQLSNVVSGL